MLGDYYSRICYKLLLKLQLLLITGSGQILKLWFLLREKGFHLLPLFEVASANFFFSVRFGEQLLSAKCSSFCHIWRVWKQSLAGSFTACRAEVENGSDAGHMFVLKCLFWCFCVCEATIVSEPSNDSWMPRVLSHRRPGHLYYTFMNIPILSRAGRIDQKFPRTECFSWDHFLCLPCAAVVGLLSAVTQWNRRE